jgi:uncharacterized protein (TIGR02391 family)
MNKQAYDRVLKFQEALINVVENYSIEEDYYNEERIFLVQNFSQKMPIFFNKCRTLKSFTSELSRIASGSGSWQARREYIYGEFENLLHYLENGSISTPNEANIVNDSINITLNKNVFEHVQELLKNKHYFNAVEESYKIVREKLREITGKEKAHEAFKKENYLIILGHKAKNEAEEDFFEGVKFLHMAIQRLRNEKAHTPAREMDKNLAIHYIVLASLAYDLITKEDM